MTRKIAGTDTTNQWGTALWSGAAGSAPFNATWANLDTFPLADLLGTANDPVVGVDGAAIGPKTLGALRFVVQVVDPNLGATSTWGSALWGSSDWSDSLGAWRDLTSRVRGITWAQGADSVGSKSAVGTATITLANTDGLASPWNNKGIFATGGSRSWLRTGLLLRFGVTYDTSLAAALRAPLAAFNPFFTGRIETIVEDTSDNVDGWVTLTVAETTADLAAYSGEVKLNDGDTISESLLRVIETVGWEYQTDLAVPSEDSLVMETTIGGYQQASYATTILELVADGLHWGICADGRGKVEAVRRHVAETDSGVVFSNQPAGTEVPVIKITPYSTKERLLNEAQASRVGGAVQIVADTGSVNQFGLITTNYGLPRDDLVLQTDAMVKYLMTRLVALYAWDDLGIDSIDLDLDLDPVNMPAILAYLASVGREATSFRIRWVHPSKTQYSEFCVMTHASHGLTMQGSQMKWTATLTVEHALRSIA